MKTNKLLIKILALITVVTVSSCVKDGDFEVPKGTGKLTESQQMLLDSITSGKIGLISFNELEKNFFKTREATLVKKNIAIKGYVTSSDEAGNFYKAFYIQDSVKNPTKGIKITLNRKGIHNRFNKGREVYISLKGLYVGESDKAGDKEISIGGAVRSGDTRVTALTRKQILQHIVRTKKTEKLQPKEVKLSEISYKNVGTLVKITNVEFSDKDLGKNFVDTNADYDSERTLQSCNGSKYDTFNLETGSFANFADTKLPKGNGTIEAVVIIDYDRNVRLMLNSFNDVKMNKERCKLQGAAFYEDFSSKNFDKWIVKNIKGEEKWHIADNYGNPKPSAKISGYNGKEKKAKENEDWLISKAINLKGKKQATLSFESVKRFKGPDLEVYMSKEYKGGNPNSDGKWVKLKVILDKNTESWDSWTSSGNIDVSKAVGGNLFIAFKYISEDSNAATFEIDNVQVSAK